MLNPLISEIQLDVQKLRNPLFFAQVLMFVCVGRRSEKAFRGRPFPCPLPLPLPLPLPILSIVTEDGLCD